MRTAPRIYADTSVFGGAFDDEFSRPSLRFFEMVEAGEFLLVTSDIVRRETAAAPPIVQDFFEKILTLAEIAPVSSSVLELRDAYISADILSQRWLNDALHVAIGAVSGCKVIVSWNFRHIVHYDKIPLYNAVNVLHGFNEIAIHSPTEVISYGEENKNF